MNDRYSEFQANGFWIEENFVSRSFVEDIINLTEEVFDTKKSATDGQVIGVEQKAVGGRNILDYGQQLLPLIEESNLFDLASELAGEPAFLVRGLYFDKPDGQSWSLPWHQDLSIATESHIDREVALEHGFLNPTKKAGTFHYQAPKSLLGRMVTLRISLDPMVEGNGPIQFFPESHRWEHFDSSQFGSSAKDDQIQTLYGDRGDVFAMSPLLVHASGSRAKDCQTRRRILHLEFSTQHELPAGIKWRWKYQGKEKVNNLSSG